MKYALTQALVLLRSSCTTTLRCVDYKSIGANDSLSGNNRPARNLSGMASTTPQRILDRPEFLYTTTPLKNQRRYVFQDHVCLTLRDALRYVGELERRDKHHEECPSYQDAKSECLCGGVER